jgi:single-stranded DNA-binding protein
MNTNQVTLIGRITAPEVKTFEKSILATASLAFESGKETGWIELKAWNNVSDSLASIPKGSTVLVTGKLSVNNYKTKDGRDVSKLFIVVQQIQKAEMTYTLIA